LRIPIRQGISATSAYAAVARRGEPFDEHSFGGSLALDKPERVGFVIHPHPAGALPVLSATIRADFEALVRALAYRSEPVPIHPAVNAQMVSGFINWYRIARLRQQWDGHPEDWQAELARLADAEPWRIRDRFIIVMTAPYSGVPAERLGLDLDEDTWIAHSAAIRIEHEFTHYATKRLYGEMRVHAFDEIIADCLGLTQAFGTYRARWGLACLGLDRWPDLRAEGRLHAYRAQLDDDAFRGLCDVVVRASQAVERICAGYYAPDVRGRLLLALTLLTLHDLAADNAEDCFAAAWQRAGR
jgi:hypothetical protein